MPTITAHSMPGWVSLFKQLKEKLGKEVPAHTTKGELHIHFNAETEIKVIWNHLIENKVNIIWSLHHQKPLKTPKQPQSTTAPRASPTRTPTPRMSVNTSRNGSPSRTRTPTPKISPDVSPTRMPTRSLMHTPTPTPKVSPIETTSAQSAALTANESHR
ncbi:hypothetical protein ACJJTC_002954 [Scirpophaga incertulas]